MIMNFLDKLELIERKHGAMGTIIGIVLILLITAATVWSIKFILTAWFEVFNMICIKYFGFSLY